MLSLKQGTYHFQMKLQIFNLAEEDFGYYKCVALNSLGRAERFIEIKGMQPNIQQSFRYFLCYETVIYLPIHIVLFVNITEHTFS